MQNSTKLFTLFVFDRKYQFCASLAQKIKIASLRWNLIPRLIRMCRIKWLLFTFFPFDRKYFFLRKFSVKCQTYQFKLKFSAWTNSNMQSSMAIFTFFVFNQKYPFRASLVQCVKIICLSWNLVTILIRICRIQCCCSLFSFLTRNTLFLAQKIKNYEFKLKIAT